MTTTMDRPRIEMGERKRIALVAHDHKKDDLLEWAQRHIHILREATLFGTGTTGRIVAEKLGLPVTCMESGPLGGDQEIGAKIVRGEIDALIAYFRKYAQQYNFDPLMLAAQGYQESTLDQSKKSHVGAIGVMQIMPRTAADMESWFFGYRVNTWDSAYDNIEMGVAYLSVLYEETGSVELALASYYQGWASVQRDGFFPDTHDYVDRIFKFREMFANGELP